MYDLHCKEVAYVMLGRTKVSVFFQTTSVFFFFGFPLCPYYLLINRKVFMPDTVKFDDGNEREAKKKLKVHIKYIVDDKLNYFC